ncbi:MAG: hypothetical protein CMF48_06270 [Legionellales bacterium]|nr:hypothetical protein [Legionellales bacterium]
MIDDKDKNESGDKFLDDDTFGDENFDIDAEYGFDSDDTDEPPAIDVAASSSHRETSEYSTPELTSSLDSSGSLPDDDLNKDSEDTFDASLDVEDEEDVFDSYDDDDDPFELTDEDDTFAASDDGDGPGGNGGGQGPMQGAPVKLIGGFAAAVAFAFITWQVFSGGSEDPVPTTVAQTTEDKQKPPSELDGLFASAESELDTLEQEVMPEDTTKDSDSVMAKDDSNTDTKVASVDSDTAMKPTETKPTPQETPSAPTVAKAPAPTNPVPAPAQPTVVKAEVDLSEIEGMLQEYNEVMSARMRRIESNIRSVSDDLDDINRNLGNMGDKVSGMGHLVSNMSDQFKMLGSSQDTDRQEMARQEMFANPSLHVHAIIPGRAWLKKHDGGILTVSEGDLLGEYGKVLAIDASSGAVVTSSGVTLR